MLQEPSEAWSPRVGETVRVVRVGTLGSVVQIKTGRYGSEFVIHALPQETSPPPRVHIFALLVKNGLR